MVKGAQIRYSTAELAWIKRNCVWPRRKAHAKFCKFFGRNDVTLDNFKALCTRKGWKTGRNGCYEKGAVPLNKGKKCEPGKGGNSPNAKRTQFKKGGRSGRALEVYKPVGTERITKDGYIERKVNDSFPLQARWRAVHLVRWEEKHGKIPKRHCLKCLDGNKGNTDPANWELIPRAALPFLNGHRGYNYDEMPADLRPAALALARVKAGKSALKRSVMS